jgi:2-amino-4-hydroxy-6-hydroxymethyldihydropteridine diphosphokinase
MAEMLLLLGGDRGDLPATFVRAGALIAGRIGPVVAQSRDHWTEPWGFTDDRLFLNRALLVASDRDPQEVMREALRIERELGRERTPGGGYGPRTIDIDILFIGGAVIDTPELVVPHPRVHQRAFALGPAADLAPDLVHPTLRRTVLDLLNDVLQAA